MINNIELIKQLLNFEDEHDFYMLYIFKRKKDQPEGEKDNHQSVRTIKSYCVTSVEYLEKRYDEIIQLCEMFKARAYIHVAKQNHRDVSLEILTALAQRIRDGQHEQQRLFDSVVGQLKTYEGKWVVDVDVKDVSVISFITKIIDNCRPILSRATIIEINGDGTRVEYPDIVTKVKATIPTKNGYHLITSRFDVIEFKKFFPEIDIQKKNPTLLYYPKSLDYGTNTTENY